MATSTKIDVELDEHGDDIMDSLDFKDIPHSSEGSDAGKTHEFTNFPHSAVDSEDETEGDRDKLLKNDESKTSSSFWTFAYYQKFFDVNTKQVGDRIVGSMFPRPRRNFLLKVIRPNPDLYGPFWICTTLVFTTAIAGNLANYFSSAGKDYHWKYDFHKVTLAATAIFGYWWLIPLILYGFLRWRSSRNAGNQIQCTFLETICVYGYSLAIYIPISMLWAIQVSWLQWLLVVIGAVLSGSVLLLTFWPAVSEDNKRIAIGTMVFVFIMHAALAGGFVLYFFYVPASTSVVPIHNTTLPISTATTTAALKIKSSDTHATIPEGTNLKAARQPVRSSKSNPEAGSSVKTNVKDSRLSGQLNQNIVENVHNENSQSSTTVKQRRRMSERTKRKKESR